MDMDKEKDKEKDNDNEKDKGRGARKRIRIIKEKEKPIFRDTLTSHNNYKKAPFARYLIYMQHTLECYFVW